MYAVLNALNLAPRDRYDIIDALNRLRFVCETAPNKETADAIKMHSSQSLRQMEIRMTRTGKIANLHLGKSRT